LKVYFKVYFTLGLNTGKLYKKYFVSLHHFCPVCPLEVIKILKHIFTSKNLDIYSSNNGNIMKNYKQLRGSLLFQNVNETSKDLLVSFLLFILK
jgi:hypothetical protein